MSRERVRPSLFPVNGRATRCVFARNLSSARYVLCPNIGISNDLRPPRPLPNESKRSILCGASRTADESALGCITYTRKHAKCGSIERAWDTSRFTERQNVQSNPPKLLMVEERSASEERVLYRASWRLPTSLASLTTHLVRSSLFTTPSFVVLHDHNPGVSHSPIHDGVPPMALLDYFPADERVRHPSHLSARTASWISGAPSSSPTSACPSASWCVCVCVGGGKGGKGEGGEGGQSTEQHHDDKVPANGVWSCCCTYRQCDDRKETSMSRRCQTLNRPSTPVCLPI